MVLLKIIQLICLLIILINFSDTHRQYRDELEYYSKARIEPRIIGGIDAEPKSAPYQVWLTTSISQYKCGGALIGPRAVLTAGHCIPGADKGKKDVEVVPTVDIYANYGGLNKNALPFKNKVVGYFVPSTYFGWALEPIDDVWSDDIGILRLQDTVVESDHVKIIEITDERIYYQICKKAYITGWGKSGDNPDEVVFPQMLKSVWLKIISKQSCDPKREPYKPISDNEICVSHPIKGTCGGDSGGPVVLDDKLVGVISKGTPGCPLGSPTVVTSTYKMSAWITSKTRDLRRRRSKLNTWNERTKSVVPFMLGREHQMPISPRTQGGTVANAGDAPWQFSMITDTKEHFCGGALIGTKLAITAAHCYYKGDFSGAQRKDIYIKYGGINRTSLPRTNKVKKWYAPNNVEADCPEAWFDTDIALLELEDDIFADYIDTMPISLYNNSYILKTESTLTGWGSHNSDGHFLATTLRKVYLDIKDRDVCEKETKPPIGSEYLCAKGPEATACISDDGGPLMVIEFGIPKLVGILTSSPGNCHLGEAATFISINKIYAWIYQMVTLHDLTQPIWE